MQNPQPQALEEYKQIEEVPTDYDKRNCTDVFCLVIGIVLTLTMVLIAIFGFERQKFIKTNFPADSEGRLCGVEVANYPYLYFAQAPEIARRVCVAKCPKKGDEKLDCTPTKDVGCRFSNTPGFEMSFYESEATTTRNGMFCYPTDETIKEKLLENSNLANRDNFMRSIDVILISLGVAFGAAIIYMLLVQFLPQCMNRTAVILGLLIMIGLVVCIALYNTTYIKSKWVAFAIFLILVIITAITVWWNLNSWKVHGIFLEEATQMVCDRIYVLAYIPLFLVLAFLFALLLLFEFRSFWMHGNLSFEPEKYLYYELHGSGVIILTVLWFLQGVWGFTFLKEAFNFCVSGTAVQWYYEKDEGFFYPIQLLLCKHLGSVVAGSFMTGFFSIFDYIFDFLKPETEEDPDGCYTNCFNSACGLCLKVFELVRSDSMAYINLAGNPYCNSARYCEYLCEQSLLMDNSQSTSRAYRICAHFLIAAAVAILAMYIKGTNISAYVIAFIIALTIFVETFFISVHADAAEAIQIIFLEDEEFHKRIREDRKDRNFNRHDIGQAFTLDRRQDLADKLRLMRIAQKQKEDEAKRQAAMNNE